MVGGLELMFSYVGNNHPNWLSYSSDGWLNHQPEQVRDVRAQKNIKPWWREKSFNYRRWNMCVSTTLRFYQKYRPCLFRLSRAPRFQAPSQSSQQRAAEQGEALDVAAGSRRGAADLLLCGLVSPSHRKGCRGGWGCMTLTETTDVYFFWCFRFAMRIPVVIEDPHPYGDTCFGADFQSISGWLKEDVGGSLATELHYFRYCIY